MPVKEIVLPFQARPYQAPGIDAIRSGEKKYAIWKYHRQSGKDLGFIGGILLPEALTTIGNYWYCFPGDKELRRDFWNKVDNYGRPVLGYYIPFDLMWRGRANESTREVQLINPLNPRQKGSLISCVAVDTIDPDTLRGPTLKGVGYSEYAYYKSGKIFSVLQPSVRSPENDGWQVILTTPNGHNHFYDMYRTNEHNPAWFVKELTIDDTGVFGDDFIEAELRRGESWEWLQQEYFCSFAALVKGVPFGEEYEYLIKERRITDVPYDPSKLVHTAWDLGKDGTVIWCFQSYGLGGYAFIDLIFDKGFNLEYYVQELRQRPYTWGTHLWPHDGGTEANKHKDYYSDQTRIEFARSLGIDPVVQKKWAKVESIAAGKRAARLCWFDKHKCDRGLHAMREYHYKYDEDTRTVGREPVHDWTSHYMDAFCTFAVGRDEIDDTGLSNLYDGMENMTDWRYDGDFDPFESEPQRGGRAFF